MKTLTKKQFINTLKNPHNERIRCKIKEFRKDIPKEWKVYSRYNKNERVFYITLIKKVSYDYNTTNNKSKDILAEFKKYFSYKLLHYDLFDQDSIQLSIRYDDNPMVRYIV